MTLLAARMGTLGTENAFRVGDDIARCIAAGWMSLRLNIGEPDFDSAPHINEAAIAQIRAGNFALHGPQGTPALRGRLWRRMSRARAAFPQTRAESSLRPVASHRSALRCRAYVDPGDEVIYPSPGFPIYESWVTYVGATPRPAVRFASDRGLRSPRRTWLLGSRHARKSSSSARRPTRRVAC